jgi:hypothetical protein
MITPRPQDPRRTGHAVPEPAHNWDTRSITGRGAICAPLNCEPETRLEPLACRS